MNGLALALNAALKSAVDSFEQNLNVHYVDYDAQFESHRFCDRDEPAPDDPDTWFFNWYTKEDPTAQALFEKLQSYQASTSNQTTGFLTTDADFIDALGDAAGDDPGTSSTLSDSVRVFHPSSLGHQKIRDVMIQALVDAGVPEPEDIPSGPEACDCNENGCSEDSPACCANGTCTSDSGPEACNCNENGCSDDSPACCANGTCASVAG